MAQRTVVELTDDIDGGPATETVLFGQNSDALEIDLNDDNADRLRDALSPFVGAARRAGGTGPRPRQRPVSAPRARAGDSDPDPKTIRAWAEANGIEVSPRGRLKGEIVEQYKAANN